MLTPRSRPQPEDDRIGTFEYRNVVFIRRDHLLQWLEDVEDTWSANQLAYDDWADAVAAIRLALAEATR